MALRCDADESRVSLSGNTTMRVLTTAEQPAPGSLIISYDLNKVMAVVRGWQEQAATAQDEAASEVYRRSAARIERLVTLSLDTPPIC